MSKPARFADCHPDKKHKAKGLCAPCYEKTKVRTPEQKARHKEMAKRRLHETQNKYTYVNHIKKAYGLTRQEYEYMLLSQQNTCAICVNNFKNCVSNIDHCHKTGKIRGILCNNCNLFLGKFKDDPILVLKSLYYLLRSNG